MTIDTERAVAERDAWARFRRLAALAKKRQHGQLTPRQFELLLNAFLQSGPSPTGFMQGWGRYLVIKRQLQHAMETEGVSVRSTAPSRLHRFTLTQSGLARLSELERKIAGRDRRNKA